MSDTAPQISQPTAPPMDTTAAPVNAQLAPPAAVPPASAAIQPDVPGNHAKMAAMLIGLGTTISAASKAIATGGREGGPQDIQNYYATQQNQALKQKQEARAESEEMSQEHLQTAQTGLVTMQAAALHDKLPLEVQQLTESIQNNTFEVLSKFMDPKAAFSLSRNTSKAERPAGDQPSDAAAPAAGASAAAPSGGGAGAGAANMSAGQQVLQSVHDMPGKFGDKTMVITSTPDGHTVHVFDSKELYKGEISVSDLSADVASTQQLITQGEDRKVDESLLAPLRGYVKQMQSAPPTGKVNAGQWMNSITPARLAVTLAIGKIADQQKVQEDAAKTTTATNQATQTTLAVQPPKPEDVQGFTSGIVDANKPTFPDIPFTMRTELAKEAKQARTVSEFNEVQKRADDDQKSFRASADARSAAAGLKDVATMNMAATHAVQADETLSTSLSASQGIRDQLDMSKGGNQQAGADVILRFAEHEVKAGGMGRFNETEFQRLGPGMGSWARSAQAWYDKGANGKPPAATMGEINSILANEDGIARSKHDSDVSGIYDRFGMTKPIYASGPGKPRMVSNDGGKSWRPAN